MSNLELTIAHCLPEDRDAACLIGRVWHPDLVGPSVVVIRENRVIDISRKLPDLGLTQRPANAAVARSVPGDDVGGLSEILANSDHARRDPSVPWFLAPIDLQAVKACGVTFAESMIERVIEEKAKGDPNAADAIRAEIGRDIGADLSSIAPGSDEAMR